MFRVLRSPALLGALSILLYRKTRSAGIQLTLPARSDYLEPTDRHSRVIIPLY